VTGVEKREIKIPIEIQKQAVGLDEKMFGVAAPAAVGPWQRQLNELGGVKPDQRISGSAVDGAPTEETRPGAAKQREEPTTRQQGQLACPVLLPVC
jgi:hypothetical protein